MPTTLIWAKFSTDCDFGTFDIDFLPPCLRYELLECVRSSLISLRPPPSLAQGAQVDQLPV
jgi:hypothetical protein